MSEHDKTATSDYPSCFQEEIIQKTLAAKFKMTPTYSFWAITPHPQKIHVCTHVHLVIHGLLACLSIYKIVSVLAGTPYETEVHLHMPN